MYADGVSGVDVVAIPIALMVVAWAYATGVRRRTGRPVPPARILAFGLGLLALAVALVSPIGALGERHLAGHMVQHVLLVGVAAPLLVLGDPLTVMLPAAPRRWRRPLRRVHRSLLRVQSGSRWLGWLAASVVVETAVLYSWHAPALFEAALTTTAVHALQHVTLLATAAVFWWLVVNARSPHAYGWGVLAIFVNTLASSALGALMTFSTHPWYPTYARLDGPGAAEDQQLGGAVMWAYGGAAALIGACAMFMAWLSSLDRAAPPSGSVGPGGRGARTAPEDADAPIDQDV